MTCDECRNLLQDLVDDEVSPAERAALDDHLNGCQECRKLERQLASFTTTVVQSVRPLRPTANFTSKVLSKYEETKAELQRLPAEPAPDAGAGRTYPTWPFAVGIALALGVGLALLFRAPEAETLGRLRAGADAARILSYTGGAWRPAAGRDAVHSGDRVVAVEAPGQRVEIDLTARLGVKIYLQSPCAVHLERRPAQLVVMPLGESPGRLFVTTGPRPAAGSDIRTVRVVYGRAWVAIACGEGNAVDVEPGAGAGLAVSVKAGAAKAGNVTEEETVAEGYARTVPQEGECGAAAQVKPDAFDWLKEE